MDAAAARPESRGRFAVTAVDAAIALAIATLGFAGFASGAEPIQAPPGLIVPMVLLESLPIAFRRRASVAVLLVILAASAVHILLLPPGQDFPSGLAVLVALYTVGERVDRRASLALLVLTLVAVSALMLLKVPMPGGLQALVQTSLVCAVAWLVGDGARIRGLYTAAVEERAALFERERTERARIAVLEERERISRELHDAVAHHVSVVVIQAGAALRALDTAPERAHAALEAIGSSGRRALTDMRRMLDMLGDAGTEPRPGLSRLGELLEEVRAAGLAVEVSVDGEPRDLGQELDASVYRIIQESLTNSLKHAGDGGRARVAVRYEPNAVSISVDDERGPGAVRPVEEPHDGRGLVGMRQRVALFRGTFAAGPTSTGFRVSAELPTGNTE
jgi:signal transduction histidine kinase